MFYKFGADMFRDRTASRVGRKAELAARRETGRRALLQDAL